MRSALVTLTAVVFAFATGAVWFAGSNWFATVCGGVSFSFSYYYCMSLYRHHAIAKNWTPAFVLLVFFLLLALKRQNGIDALPLGASWFDFESDLLALVGMAVGVALAHALLAVTGIGLIGQKDSSGSGND